MLATHRRRSAMDKGTCVCEKIVFIFWPCKVDNSRKGGSLASFLLLSYVMQLCSATKRSRSVANFYSFYSHYKYIQKSMRCNAAMLMRILLFFVLLVASPAAPLWWVEGACNCVGQGAAAPYGCSAGLAVAVAKLGVQFSWQEKATAQNILMKSGIVRDSLVSLSTRMTTPFVRPRK